MPDAPLLPPELRDRFEVDGELGRGAFGTVLRATDTQLGRPVAIKLLHPLAEGEARDRFDREAALLASLNHPGVVRLYDFGHSSQGPYLVLELLEGRPLNESPDLDLMAVARDLGPALEAIHAAGVIHRDIKPANLLRNAEGRVVLADFGLARVPERETQALTRTGAVVGTPAYLAPEIWAGEDAGPAADWFALGVTLFELRERRYPWGALLLMAHAKEGDLPPPRFGDGVLRSGLRRAIEALLAPDPADRPASARELERLLQGEERAFRRPGSQETVRPAPGRRGWLVAGVVAAGVLVGALGVGDAPAPLRSPPLAPTPVPEDPVTTRRRALDAALAELLDGHRNAAGDLAFARRDGSPGEHLIEVVDQSLAPDFPDRVERIHDALAAWLAVAPPALADRELEASVLPALEHLAQDRGMLAWYEPTGIAYGSTPALALHETPGVTERLRRRLEGLAKRRAAWSRRLAAWDQRLPILRLLTTISWGIPQETSRAYCFELLDRYDAAGSPAERADLAALALRLAPPAAEMYGAFTCADRHRLTDALVRSTRELSATPETSSPGLRGVVSGGAVYRHYLDLVSCPDEATPGEVAALGELLELADAAGVAAPAPISIDLENVALFDRMAALFLPDLGPELPELVRQAQEIALRHEARIRKQPREVGLGNAGDGKDPGMLRELRGFGKLFGGR